MTTAISELEDLDLEVLGAFEWVDSEAVALGSPTKTGASPCPVHGSTDKTCLSICYAPC